MNNTSDQQYNGAKQATSFEQADAQNIDALVTKHLEDAIISHALRMQKPLESLDQQDFIKIYGELSHYQMLKHINTYNWTCIVDCYQEVIQIILHRLESKIKEGNKLVSCKTIIHTAPHHDDIVLGYHTYAMRLLPCNKNYVLYMTNGSNGVSDDYITDCIENCMLLDHIFLQQMIFEKTYNQLLEQFAQAFHSQNQFGMEQARQLIFLKIFIELFDCIHIDQLQQQLRLLQQQIQLIQDDDQSENSLLEKLKGRLRQSESDCKWVIAQGHCDNITHFGARFYQDDTQQAVERDIQLLVAYFKRIQPDIITLALDPCGVGPTNHFASLQIIAQALQRYGNHTITIIGYRNVWGAFTISQASMFIPVTAQEIDTMRSIFCNCFATQKNPPFPSQIHDGPFSDIAAQFLEQQGQDIALLQGQVKGDKYLFLQKLSLDELLKFAGLDD